MAPRKKKTKTRAPAETAMIPFDASQLVLPWQQDDELDKLIERQQRAAGTVGGWPFISTKGGVFSLGDVELEGFDCFVLSHARMNSYFVGAYRPDRRDSPDCWAIQDMEQLEGEMAPPPNLPNKESEACFGCPQNEFGSDNRGRGKACKNVHVVGLIVLDDGKITPDSISRARGTRLRIPPTSRKWAEVVDLLSAKRIPLPFMRFRFGIEDDPNTQFQIQPFPTELVSGASLQQALLARVEEADRQVRQEPPAKAKRKAGVPRAVRKTRGKKKAKPVRRRGAR